MSPPINGQPGSGEPFKIQLALQGGGAKIYALLAALQAVEKLQHDPERPLRVTRVAGTSAGAIAGTLFAAGVPMSEVTNVLLGEKGKKLVGSFQLPGKGSALLSLWRGLPFWGTKPLAEVLEGFLATRNIRTFDDIKKQTGIEAIVIAANLGDSRAVTLKGDALVVQSLLDSAGLPFCFRTWSSKGGAAVLVDGGICENLPIGDLKKDEVTEGQIVAFTFPFLRAGSPENLKGFTMALLDSAINNSMNRAKSSISETAIFEIPTSLGTFDFKRALEQGKNEAFELIHDRTERFLRDLMYPAENQKAIVQNIPWMETNKTTVMMMESLGAIYQTHHAKSLFKYLTCRFVITLKSVLPKEDPHFGDPDVLAYSATFHPLDEPIHCLSTAISRPPDVKNYLGRTSWDLRDQAGNPVTIVSLPTRNPTDPEAWELVHFLNPVIPPRAGEFKFSMEDEMYNYMEKLMSEGRDDLVLFPRRAEGCVDRIEIIIHAPTSRSRLRMVPKNGDRRGRPMRTNELPQSPYGFFTMGWVGEKIEAHPSFGVDVLL